MSNNITCQLNKVKAQTWGRLWLRQRVSVWKVQPSASKLKKTLVIDSSEVTQHLGNWHFPPASCNALNNVCDSSYSPARTFVWWSRPKGRGNALHPLRKAKRRGGCGLCWASLLQTKIIILKTIKPWRIMVLDRFCPPAADASMSCHPIHEMRNHISTGQIQRMRRIWPHTLVLEYPICPPMVRLTLVSALGFRMRPMLNKACMKTSQTYNTNLFWTAKIPQPYLIHVYVKLVSLKIPPYCWKRLFLDILSHQGNAAPSLWRRNKGTRYY